VIRVGARAPVLIERCGLARGASLPGVATSTAAGRPIISRCGPTTESIENSLGAHAARSTLITQVSRSLVLINVLGTTGILIPKALNAARMRAAWIPSLARAARQAGYSESVARKPKIICESPAVLEAWNRWWNTTFNSV
jgi:hypothetical protein